MMLLVSLTLKLGRRVQNQVSRVGLETKVHCTLGEIAG